MTSSNTPAFDFEQDPRYASLDPHRKAAVKEHYFDLLYAKRFAQAGLTPEEIESTKRNYARTGLPEVQHLEAAKPGDRRAKPAVMQEAMLRELSGKDPGQALDFRQKILLDQAVDLPAQFVLKTTETLADAVTLGGASRAFHAAGFEPPAPLTSVAEVGQGLGHLAGFATAAHGVSHMKDAVLKKLYPQLKPATGVLSATASRVANEAATLGVTSAVVEPALGDLPTVLKNKLRATVDGAALGTFFGVAGLFNVQKYPVLSGLFRVGVGTAALDAMHGTSPFDARDVVQKAFDYGLNAWFLRRGASPHALANSAQLRQELTRLNAEREALNKEISERMPGSGVVLPPVDPAAAAQRLATRSATVEEVRARRDQAAASLARARSLPRPNLPGGPQPWMGELTRETQAYVEAYTRHYGTVPDLGSVTSKEVQEFLRYEAALRRSEPARRPDFGDVDPGADILGYKARTGNEAPVVLPPAERADLIRRIQVDHGVTGDAGVLPDKALLNVKARLDAEAAQGVLNSEHVAKNFATQAEADALTREHDVRPESAAQPGQPAQPSPNSLPAMTERIARHERELDTLTRNARSNANAKNRAEIDRQVAEKTAELESLRSAHFRHRALLQSMISTLRTRIDHPKDADGRPIQLDKMYQVQYIVNGVRVVASESGHEILTSQASGKSGKIYVSARAGKAESASRSNSPMTVVDAKLAPSATKPTKPAEVDTQAELKSLTAKAEELQERIATLDRGLGTGNRSALVTQLEALQSQIAELRRPPSPTQDIRAEEAKLKKLNDLVDEWIAVKYGKPVLAETAVNKVGIPDRRVRIQGGLPDPKSVEGLARAQAEGKVSRGDEAAVRERLADVRARQDHAKSLEDQINRLERELGIDPLEIVQAWSRMVDRQHRHVERLTQERLAWIDKAAAARKAVDPKGFAEAYKKAQILTRERTEAEADLALYREHLSAAKMRLSPPAEPSKESGIILGDLLGAASERLDRTFSNLYRGKARDIVEATYARLFSPAPEPIMETARRIEERRMELNVAEHMAAMLSRDIVERVPEVARRELMAHAIEQPERYMKDLSPAEAGLVQELRRNLDEWHDLAQRHGVLEAYVENYLPHMYKGDPAANARILHDSKVLSTHFSHGQRRVIPTLEVARELKQAGVIDLEPITDIATILPIYKRRLDQVIATKKLIDSVSSMKDERGNPLVLYPSDAAQIPAGWRKLADERVSTGFKRFLVRKVSAEDFAGKNVREVEKLIQERVPYVEPRTAKLLEDIMDHKTGNFLRSWLTAKNHIKRLIMFNPMIHGWNIYSEVLNEHIGSQRGVLFGAVKAYKDIFGKGLGTSKDIDVLELEWVRYGLEIERSSFIDGFRKTLHAGMDPAAQELLTPGGGTIVKPQHRNWYQRAIAWSDNVLWNRIARHSLISIAELKSAQLAQQYPNLPAAQIKKLAAHMANDLVGGLPSTWMSANSRRYGELALFARNWVYSNWNVLSKAAFREGLGYKQMNMQERQILQLEYSKHIGRDVLSGLIMANLLSLAFTGKTSVQQDDDFDFSHAFDVATPFFDTGHGRGRIWVGLPLFRFVNEVLAIYPRTAEGESAVHGVSRVGFNKLEPMLKFLLQVATNRDFYTGQEILPKGFGPGSSDRGFLLGAWDTIKYYSPYALESLTPTTQFTGRLKNITFPESLSDLDMLTGGRHPVQIFSPLLGMHTKTEQAGGHLAAKMELYLQRRDVGFGEIDRQAQNLVASGRLHEAVRLLLQSRRINSTQGIEGRITRYLLPFRKFSDSLSPQEKIAFFKTLSPDELRLYRRLLASEAARARVFMLQTNARRERRRGSFDTP